MQTENQVATSQKKSNPAELSAGLILNVIPKLMHELRKDCRCLKQKDLTVPQFRILAFLECEPSGVKELAENMGVSRPAVSRMVKGLSQKKLVEVARDSQDKRNVTLVLTKLGKKRMAEMRTQLQALLTQRLGPLEVEELRTLQLSLVAIQRVFESLQAKRDLLT